MKSEESRSVILDTCIVQYVLRGEWEYHTAQVLHDLRQAGFSLNVSSVTLFEILRTATGKLRENAQAVLDGISRYEVTDSVLEFAADLYGFYRTDKEIKRFADKISSEDMIIGATTAITDSFLLTANMVDFPSPFFREKEIWRAENTRNKRSPKSLYFCLLEPNEQAMNDAKEGKMQS